VRVIAKWYIDGRLEGSQGEGNNSLLLFLPFLFFFSFLFFLLFPLSAPPGFAKLQHGKIAQIGNVLVL